MTEDERQALVQIQLLTEDWMECRCTGGCPTCIDRIDRVHELTVRLLGGETHGTTTDSG